MPSIFNRSFKDAVAAARGQPANWGQSDPPMGSRPSPTPVWDQLTSMRGWGQPSQPVMGIQNPGIDRGPGYPMGPDPMQGPAGSIPHQENKYGSKTGPTGPAITLPGQSPGRMSQQYPQLSNAMNYSVGRR